MGNIADAARKSIGAAPVSSTPAVGTDLTARQVPAQRVPKPEEAEADFLKAARENYGLKHPGPEASQLATQIAARIRAKPADIPAEPSLMEEVGLAFSPAQQRGDARPTSIAAAPKYVAQRGLHAVVGDAMSLVDPFWLNPIANKARDLTMPEAEKGLPTENHILWAMRVAGTTIPAIIQETIERTPMPAVADAGKAAMAGHYAEAATKFFTPSSVGQQMLGVEPGELQRVHRDNPVADWAEGWLERVEEGRGLEEDFARSVVNRLGPDHPNLESAAWWLGFGVDAFTDWEGGLVKGGHVATEVARKAKELGVLAPEMGAGSRVWAALSNNYLSSDWLGEKIAKHLEDGGSIDDVPAPIRARMEQVALETREQPLVELADTTGIGAPRTLQVEDLGYQERLDAARKEEQAGKVPGVFADRRDVAERPDLAEATKKRPPLPEFRRQPSDAEGWYKAVVELYKRGEHPAGGYNWRHHDGFNRLIGAEEMTPDRFTYVVRNAKGDVIRQTDYAGAVESVLKRQLDGDSIWDGETRPVARWSKTDKPRLTTDYLFASPTERRIVEVLRSKEGDPRAWPGRLRQIKAQREARAAEKNAGAIIADSMTDAPPGAPPLSEMGQVAVDATRLALRDMMGSHELKALPNGSMVARSEHGPMLKAMQARVGVSPERAKKLIAGAAPTAEEEAKLAALAARNGLDRPAGVLTTKLWTQLRHAALSESGGVLADIRYRVAGTRPFTERMWAAVADAASDRRKWGAIGDRLVHNGPLAWIAKRFAEDKFGPLSAPVRSRLNEARVRLGRNADDMLHEFNAMPRDLSPAAKMQALVLRYTTVHPDEVARASTVPNAEGIAQLRAEWTGPRPKWLDQNEPLLFQAGFRSWGKAALAAAEDSGRAWVQSNIVAAGKSILPDLLQKQIPSELAVALYREAFERGQLQGPALLEALRLVNLPEIKLDTTHALVTHALHLRAEAIVAEEMDALLGVGAVVRSDDLRRPALQAAVLGQHKSWNPTLERWDFRYPEAATTFAVRQLEDWGVEVGSGAALVDKRVGNQKVTLPKEIADEVARLVASAQLDSRVVYQGAALNTLLRAFKEWTTHGVIMPNPAFFIGQAVSLLPTMVTTRGYAGAAQAAGAFGRHPAFVGSLVKRLAGGGSPTFESRVAEGWLLQTATGEIVSIEDLEEAARRHGLQDTRTSFETADSLKSVIAADGADYAILDPRRLLMPARWWQNKIREVAGGFDLTARMAVFVDQVERGVPMDQAAGAAREAALDFRALTEWEARYMRQIFTFYAFMRKNSDAYVKALFRNPGRVMSQIRLAHASATASLSPLELGAVSDADVARLTVYDDDEVVNDQGRPHPFYRMNRLQTTPMGVAEWMGTVRSMGGIFGGDREQFAQNITPLGQTLAVLLMGRKLDRDYDSPYNNRIPPVLMDSFLSPVLFDAFGVGPVALRTTDDPLQADDDATRELGAHQPAVWAAGGDRSLTPEQQAAARDRWQQFLIWFSRPLGTAQQAAEAIGAEPVPANLTQNEATMAFWLGLKYRPALNEREAVRRGLTAREYRFRDATDAIALPGKRRSR